MLLFLSKYPKSIARFFIISIYLNLVLLPSSVKASPVRNHSSKEFWNPILWKNFFVAPTSVHERTAVSNDEVSGSFAASMPNGLSTQISNTGRYTTGPTQPEMATFSSVNNSNMVDLFTGDFSYNIPLLDVGGYPVNLAYRSGISMDQEASWVGLGWNINPGTITR